MNPIRSAAGLIQLPVHAAAAVAGTAAGVAATGVRTTARVVGWAVERATGPAPRPPASPWVSDAPPVVVPEADAAPEQASAEETPQTVAPATNAPAKTAAKKAAAEKAPAKKAPAKKAPARKTARKAPSRKAAVIAPALGLSEEEAADVLRTPSGIPAAGDAFNPDTTETDLHQPGTEPLMDPSLTKAVASESEVLRRAADTDKG